MIFINLDDLKNLQEKQNQVLIGRFEAKYPCMVTEKAHAKDTIQFEIKGRGRHQYRGFEGYDLTFLRALCSDGKEAGYVFRAK